MTEEDFNWRNVNVLRSRKYEPLVEKLCSRKSSYSNKPIFEFNKDLMVFAAVVGHSLSKKESVDKDAIQITLGTYASDEKDGYIYLIALLQEKNVEVLKQENIHDAVRIFEEYCNGGLSVIQSWMDDNPGDIEGVDTLVEKIFDQLINSSIDGGTQQNKKEVTF
tara:strand:+ start:1017 stop:1508 length:492 start_codon:yes stop_codon:yes gene_type:complete